MESIYNDLSTERRRADALRLGGRDRNGIGRPIAALIKSIASLPANAVALGIHFTATVGTFGTDKNIRNSLLYTIYNLGMTLLNICTLGCLGYAVDAMMGEAFQDKNGLKTVLARYVGIESQFVDKAEQITAMRSLTSGKFFGVGGHLRDMRDDDIDAAATELKDSVTSQEVKDSIDRAKGVFLSYKTGKYLLE